MSPETLSHLRKTAQACSLIRNFIIKKTVDKVIKSNEILIDGVDSIISIILEEESSMCKQGPMKVNFGGEL